MRKAIDEKAARVGWVGTYLTCFQFDRGRQKSQQFDSQMSNENPSAPSLSVKSSQGPRPCKPVWSITIVKLDSVCSSTRTTAPLDGAVTRSETGHLCAHSVLLGCTLGIVPQAHLEPTTSTCDRPTHPARFDPCGENDTCSIQAFPPIGSQKNRFSFQVEPKPRRAQPKQCAQSPKEG